MSTQITYKYNIGDTVQIKTEFDSTASIGLKELAGETVTIIDRRYYGALYYKFEGLEDRGWFSEGCISGKVNPYVIFVGESQDDLEPIASAPSHNAAISVAKALQSEFSLVEVVYMPEEDEATNTIIYAHYEEVI